MARSRRPSKTLRRLLLVLALSGWAGGAAAQGSAQWGCDAPVGRTCYFSLITGGGVRSFSLPAGRKTTLSGVVIGRDEYLVSIDAPNFGDLNRCRQLVAVGRSCQRKAVDSYND